MRSSQGILRLFRETIYMYIELHIDTTRPTGNTSTEGRRSGLSP